MFFYPVKIIVCSEIMKKIAFYAVMFIIIELTELI